MSFQTFVKNISIEDNCSSDGPAIHMNQYEAYYSEQ